MYSIYMMYLLAECICMSEHVLERIHIPAQHYAAHVARRQQRRQPACLCVCVCKIEMSDSLTLGEVYRHGGAGGGGGALD